MKREEREPILFFLTHILAMEGDSEVIWYPGNYSEYEEDLRRRVGDEAANPHRVKYRRLA